MPPAVDKQYRVMLVEEVEAVVSIATANAKELYKKDSSSSLEKLTNDEFRKITGADRAPDSPDAQIMSTQHEAGVQSALQQYRAQQKTAALPEPKVYNRRATEIEELVIKDELNRRFKEQFGDKAVDAGIRQKFMDQEKEKITGFPTIPIPYTTISTEPEHEDRIKRLTEGFVARELEKLLRDGKKDMIRDPYLNMPSGSPFDIRPIQTTQAPENGNKRSI